MNDRDSILEHGLFWLSKNDERKLWGTLRISEVNEVRLETFGSLISKREDIKQRITGIISGGKGYVTLVGCVPIHTEFVGEKWDGRDWSHQTCLADQALKGIAFEEGEEIAFEEAILYISTLTKWVNPDIVELEFAGDSTRPLRVNVSITEKADETTTVNFLGEKIKVSIVFRPAGGWKTHGQITKYSVEDSCFLAIERADGSKMPLKNILSATDAMLNLLSIGCNETPSVSGLSVYYKKREKPPVRVFVRMRGHDVEAREKYPFPAIGLKELGGVEVIARWLKVTERYGATVGLLTSNWFEGGAYSEDRFARTYTAVEGLVSRKKARNRARMNSKELADFVESAVPGFSGLTNCPAEDWAERVKNIRDQRVSHLDPVNTTVTDGLTINMMTNLLYVAGASFLLREMAVEEPEIEGYIQGCYQSLLLSDQQYVR